MATQSERLCHFMPFKINKIRICELVFFLQSTDSADPLPLNVMAPHRQTRPAAREPGICNGKGGGGVGGASHYNLASPSLNSVLVR